MNSISISRKLFIWILMAAILPTTLLAIFYLTSFRAAYLEQEKNNLSELADEKVNQLETYINEAIIDVEYMSTSLAAIKALTELPSIYNNRKKKPEIYLAREEIYHKYFQKFISRGYYDIFVISTDGEVLLSLTHENDFAKNIFTGKYQNSGLNRAVRRAKYLLETSFSNFSFYDASNNSSAFVASPVIYNQRLLGFVAIQIDSKIINKIVFSNNSSINSRETVVGLKNNDTSFSFQAPLKFKSDITLGELIPIEKISKPLFNALNGQRHIGVDFDYRGVKVLSASRYIPSLNWGLVLKEDYVEVMQIINELVSVGIVIFIFIIFAVVILTTFLGRTITEPIISITNTAHAIAKGDTKQKVNPYGFKESIDLAESFNIMSANLQESKDTLEQKVEERTYELEEALLRLKKISERLPGMIYQYELRADGTASFPYVSEAIREIYRATPEEAKNDVAKVFEVLHPDDFDEVVASINKSAETLEPWQLEYRVRYNDGTVRWLFGNSIPEKTDEGSILWHGFITDITERKNIEDALKQAHIIIENSPVIVIQWAAKEGWPVEFVSENITQFGYNTEELLSGKIPYSSIIHPDDLERVGKEVEKYSASGDSFFQQEYRIVGSDGTVYWTDDRTMVERDKDGNITHYQGTILDVSERKKIEVQLRHSQKMDALGKLTGGIAHDYNNILGIVMGYAELLESNLKEQPSLVKYAHEIYHAAERGSKLTRKLLTFSRKGDSESVILNINSLLLEEQHMLEKTLTARIQLIFELDKNIWMSFIDESDLEDAVLNISINAMHAIKEIGTFTIKTANEKLNAVDAKILKLQAGDYVSVSMSDSGSGMDENILTRVFDPFFTTKGQKGTGLGLSQVYSFVQRSNGAITINSELGQGTIVKLYFPRCEKDVVSDDKNNTVVNLTGTETILIVDDEPALLSMACELLSEQGYKVLSAERGKEALSIMEKETVDLLLSDVIMPEMDGYQLAAIVKKEYPKIKIQLASGFSDDRHLTATDTGLHEHLIKKPYSTNTLSRRIRELLDS